MEGFIPTTNTRIRGVLRQLFVSSRERGACLKRDKYTCQECHRKQSAAKGKEFKVQVHHKEGVLNWQELIEQVRKYLLCDPDNLQTLCAECHSKKTSPPIF